MLLIVPPWMMGKAKIEQRSPLESVAHPSWLTGASRDEMVRGWRVLDIGCFTQTVAPWVRYPPPVVLHLKEDAVPGLSTVNLQANTILSSEGCWQPELACFTALQIQIVGARVETLGIHRMINATDAVGVLG